MALITVDDLKGYLTESRYLAIFDDDNDGIIDGEAAKVVARAIAIVQAKVAPHYTGTTPIEQTPAVALLQHVAIAYAAALSYRRHPEYAKSDGDREWKEAEALMGDVASGVAFLADHTSQTQPGTVGGAILEDTHHVILNNPDGTSNSGDF